MSTSIMQSLWSMNRRWLYTRVTQVVIDAGICATAYWLAFLVRFDGQIPADYTSRAVSLCPYVVALTLLMFGAFGVYRFVWRYVNIREVGIILLALISQTAILTAGRVLLPEQLSLLRIPRGVIVINFGASAFGIIGVRLLRRLLYERSRAARFEPRSEAKRVVLVGAGDAGVIVAKELIQRPDLALRVVGFIDDDPRKRRARIAGLKVLGPTSDLPRLALKYRIEEVIITFSSASPQAMRHIVGMCEEISLRVRIVPGIYEILGDRVSVSKLREVRIEDLLARDVVSFEKSQDMLSTYRGRRILVTGAGGSIGSELSRQLTRLEPESLVLVDKDENNVFEIHANLIELGMPREKVVPLILDLRQREAMARAFQTYRPDVILHAAAFKHVPLLEDHVVEAVENNVFGTAQLVDLALAFNISSFVMVSTDKAVNPTNVMGATKRIAEMVVQAAAQQSPVRFSCVRFGNVLESRGSVVPVFRRQIARGGPVTVTHPDVTRFFMTIPEAAQLVIQAGSLGRRGEIFVLDMGEPVRIIDLARDLIRLSGLREPEDIAIEIIGLRPGEKLYEELLVLEEGTHATKFQKIFIAPSRPVSRDAIRNLLALLRAGIEANEPAAIVHTMRQADIGFQPDARFRLADASAVGLPSASLVRDLI